MLRFIRIEARDRSGDDKFNAEIKLYEVIREFCSKSTRIVEGGPDVGPWTPILLEHLAYEKALTITWAGIEKVARDWKKENEYSDYVMFNQDICEFAGTSGVDADMTLSIRPRVYGVSESQLGGLINRQHRQLLAMTKTGGYLIIMIHQSEFHHVQPFWMADNALASVVTSKDATPNKILVLRKK